MGKITSALLGIFTSALTSDDFFFFFTGIPLRIPFVILGHVEVFSTLPFFMEFGEERPDEPEYRGFVWEYPDHAFSAPDLLNEPLLHVRRFEPTSVLCWQGIDGQCVLQAVFQAGDCTVRSVVELLCQFNCFCARLSHVFTCEDALETRGHSGLVARWRE